MIDDRIMPEEMETPSGKSAASENFPVASLLIAPALRPHVARFYDFARAIDDIADNPDLPATEKIERLDIFAAAVAGKTRDAALDVAIRMHESLIETSVPVKHCHDLVSAFKQDAVKGRYENWAELIDYCNRSASPVGRYLLDLHKEDCKYYPLSDALCNSLQVINHMQDCGNDYKEVDRVYLPGDWLEAKGARVEDLAGSELTPALRAVLDHCVAGCEALNEKARGLPLALKSRRLAAESGVIITIAHKLTMHLSRRDPLAERVVLGKSALLICTILGAGKAMMRIR